MTFGSSFWDAVVDVKILDDRIQNEFGLPSYAKEGDAGMDLIACINEPITIKEGENVLIPTGIAIHINNPYIFAALMPRSGLGHKKGLVLANLVGVIDSGYQDQVYVSAWNRKHFEHKVVDTGYTDENDNPISELQQIDHSITINPGDKIAQMIFVPIVRASFNVVDGFEQSDRGENGFGSTDR